MRRSLLRDVILILIVDALMVLYLPLRVEKFVVRVLRLVNSQ